jgi:hypothetical protein
MISDYRSGDRRDGHHGDHYASLDHFCASGVRGTQLSNLKELPR